MDYPYHVFRRGYWDMEDQHDLNRAQFRYLGDALSFVKHMVKRETYTTVWTIVNVEQDDRLCFKARYEDGQVTYPTGDDR